MLIKEYTRAITECLDALYDDQSIYYDENNLLVEFLNDLYVKFIDNMILTDFGKG